METVILIIYFLFVLAVGFYSSLKIKKPADYYVAGKNARFVPVTGSLLATILGGSAILGTIELSQKTGWPALWFLFCASLGLFFLVPLSKYVKRFGNYTLPELLGTFYGKKAAVISSVIIPIAWLGIIAAQIIAAAKILSGLGGMSYATAALVSGAVFVIYTLLGGQISILKTDTLQSALIVTGLLALLLFAIRNQPFANTAPLTAHSLFNDSFSLLDLIILILTYSVTFIVGPDIYSRVFCAKNERTARRSILTVAFLLIPISFLLTYLGIYSSGNSEESIVAFAQHLLPGWAYGLFTAALLSAVMSSADTTLLTSSMIISELVTSDLNKSNSLKTTRLFIVLIGGASIFVALFVTSIIQALLFALTFFSGAFFIPVLAGLLQLKTNRKMVVTAMVAGGLVALTGKIIAVYYVELYGNVLIIFSYFLNSFFLFSKR
ncbi:MAG: sodium:solute symporter family protein [Prolixibacteraceae bacterium]|nr:sodium:solute symporter family protein [Prolixibacteraceae bacterium]